jgi:hypothetical protein
MISCKVRLYHTKINQRAVMGVRLLLGASNQTSLSVRLGAGLIPASSSVWVYHDVTPPGTVCAKTHGCDSYVLISHYTVIPLETQTAIFETTVELVEKW